ncbi:hypothetical protein Ahy_A06g027817 isoform A [Arachis hypogaea]|uniref:peptidylprolyl isomerase n=1 Tax=Arachis hypogaea TaxID=3818 RepID=A0A445CPV5_ARAHY|nr:hypothetical protein Ahy_A06g027817 isoform A [Arachis hypogaea]
MEEVQAAQPQSLGELPAEYSVPPKIDSEVEVLHEKVTKQVIKEGHGQKPSKYSTCFIHYRGWSESTQHKFEDTWQEQRPIEMVLGKASHSRIINSLFMHRYLSRTLISKHKLSNILVNMNAKQSQESKNVVAIVLLDLLSDSDKEMTGLAIGVANMKDGERALLRVGWELGYGEEGSFSFPNVPPRADLVYEVELIGFDETKEGKARSDMTVEERIGAADRRKMDGNVLFQQEKLEEAMQQP